MNHSVSFRKKENSFILEKPSSYPEQLTSTSSSTIMPPKFPDVNKVQKRSHSQPIFTQYSKYKSMLSLESDSDSESDDVIISSGVELGAKNRYKDIFPYEHSRVILKKRFAIIKRYQAFTFYFRWWHPRQLYQRKLFVSAKVFCRAKFVISNNYNHNKKSALYSDASSNALHCT